jgi:transcriptional regulator with XRE-family HTH domain
MGDIIDMTARLGPQGFRAEVRRARLAKGLSQAELAAASGLSLTDVELCESGPNRIGADALRRVAAALDVPVADLIGTADYGEGELATPQEVLALLTIMIALPAPIRVELQRFAEALAQQPGRR